jgi:hypothetical protein
LTLDLAAVVEHVEQVVPGSARTRAETRDLGAGARLWDWALEHALLFPIVALFLATSVTSLPRELLSDSWFALFGGHEIVRHGLPGQDTVAIWTHGRDWVDQQWLGQLVLYALYAVGGVKLALLGHALAVGSAFVLALAFARRRGASLRSICWLALPVIFLLIWGSWNARAQSLAFVLFVSVVWLLIADARAPSRRVLLVFPVLILWANVHGSAITGAMLVILAGVTYALERRREPWRTWVPRVALLCAAPVACLFVSPYALKLPGYYSHVLFNSSFRDYIVEWRPTALNAQTAPFYLLAFAAVWLIGRCAKRVTPFEQALLVVTILMGLQTTRMVVWFALVALMVMPTVLDGMLKSNTAAARLPMLNRALILVSIAGTVTTVAAVAAKPSSWFERSYPAEALVAVKQAELGQPGVRVFANEQYSNWLLLRRPELRGRIAFDIRFELISKRRLAQLVNVRRQVEGWRKVVAPYGLFVLSQDADRLFAKGLLRQDGARRLYRGHGVIVISRPVKRYDG